MTQQMKLLMLGLSESGKTTFLAALYELVVEENAVEGRLRERKQLEDREYFQRIRRRWLDFQPLLHSQRSTNEETRLSLIAPDGQELDLEVPDIAGESFDEAWRGDDWPDVVTEHALVADGILVFLRADSIVPPGELERGESLGDWDPSPEEASADDHLLERHVDWEPGSAPTQSKLADLLEGIESARHELVPTAVIISAWDTVKDEQTPAQWLEFEAPLFWQMLVGREEERDFEIFGVSAQGGDITKEAVRTELAKIRPPISRVQVQHRNEISHDISAPIAWLMGRS